MYTDCETKVHRNSLDHTPHCKSQIHTGPYAVLFLGPQSRYSDTLGSQPQGLKYQAKMENFNKQLFIEDMAVLAKKTKTKQRNMQNTILSKLPFFSVTSYSSPLWTQTFFGSVKVY